MLERDYKSKLKVFLRKAGNILIYWSGLYCIFYWICKQPGIYIVYYHRVVDGRKGGIISKISVDRRNIEEQLKYYSMNFSIIPMDKAVELLKSKERLDRKYLVITFDDGYQDNYQNALPILRKAGFVATVFVTSGKLNQSWRWEKERGRPEARVLSEQQIRQLAAAGWDIGSHTMTHKRLTQESMKVVQAELENSRTALEKIVARPVRSFAYPFGAFNTAVAKAVQSAGYDAAVTTLPGTSDCKGGFYTLPRYRVNGNHSFSDFVRLFR
jgi:peptidoglycan/xylan/chitin deacetylase (PgdA/CDA1 family)